MFNTYLVSALRSLWRHRLASILNIAGLATAMACCLMTFFYIRHELAYDRFHANADDIYRLAVERRYPASATTSALTPRSLAAILEAEFPEVQHATRLSREHAARVLVRSNDAMFYEEGVVFADPDVFEVFTLPLVAGDPAQALSSPRSIVITESAARKYFGNAEAVGKILTLRLLGDGDRFDYTITGVARDAQPASHFHFDFLATYQGHPFTTTEGRERPSFENADVYTYLLLQPGVNLDRIAANIAEVITENSALALDSSEGSSVIRNPANGGVMQYFLQPLTDIHLRSQLADEIQPTGSMTQLMMLGGIAGFILLLACVNFANLATAQASTRVLEAGMRKILGSSRTALAGRFFTEALVLSLLALLPALGVVELLLPSFENFVDIPFDVAVPDTMYLLFLLIAFAGFVACIAGLYPAFFLAATRPILLLRTRRDTGRSRLRDGLVVFQFSVAITLMIGTGVIFAQLYFMAGSRLGFNEEQVLVLEGTEVVRNQGEAFRQSVLAIPGVLSAANGESMPGRPLELSLIKPEGNAEGAQMARLFTGFGYAETLGLNLVEGRSLSFANPGDDMGALLNQKAVADLGLIEPIGQRLTWETRTYTVTGVVEDYHQASLHEAIGPVMLVGPDPEFENRPYQFFAIRFDTADVDALLTALTKVWKQFAPQQPIAYSFLDSDLDALYRSDEVAATLAAALACVAIFIACLGLYGLACFNTDRRRKEIGVRKVMGGSVWSIVVLLTSDFSKLVLLANILAWPAAYFAMERWLENFAYHIDLAPLIFIGSGLVALCIAWVTVGGTAAKAANQKPVLALRYE